jgi:hypothetical protein
MTAQRMTAPGFYRNTVQATSAFAIQDRTIPVFPLQGMSLSQCFMQHTPHSLTPTTISGVCGRLKCCLKYEHEGYLEMEKNMPRRGDCCECAEGRGRIADRNLLTQKVTVELDDTGRTVTLPKEEVRVVYPEKYKIQNNEQEKQDNNNNHAESSQNQNQKRKDKPHHHHNKNNKQGNQKA